MTKMDFSECPAGVPHGEVIAGGWHGCEVLIYLAPRTGLEPVTQ